MEASQVAKVRLNPSKAEKGWAGAPASVPPHGAGGVGSYISCRILKSYSFEVNESVTEGTTTRKEDALYAG